MYDPSKIDEISASDIHKYMKWKAVDFDWSQVRAFIATANEGSFSAAARALKLTQPTLARQVTALEDNLGVTLFERGKRSMLLTEAGHSLLPHAQGMLDHAIGLSLAAAGRRSSLSGVVTLTATSLFAMFALPRAVKDLQISAPELQIEIIASNSLQDLKRREADIAIRHVRPTQDDLIGKLIGQETANIYGSKDYLDRKGRPRSKAQIAKLDLIAFTSPEETREFYRNHGIPCDLDQFQVVTSMGEVALSLVQHGLGLSILPDRVGRYIDGLEPVLPHNMKLEFPVWLVTHRELETNPRIRHIFDCLSKTLSHV